LSTSRAGGRGSRALATVWTRRCGQRRSHSSGRKVAVAGGGRRPGTSRSVRRLAAEGHRVAHCSSRSVTLEGALHGSRCAERGTTPAQATPLTEPPNQPHPPAHPPQPTPPRPPPSQHTHPNLPALTHPLHPAPPHTLAHIPTPQPPSTHPRPHTHTPTSLHTPTNSPAPLRSAHSIT
jgi:hypothetical protein